MGLRFHSNLNPTLHEKPELLPICHKLSNNWVDIFFRQVGKDQAAVDDNDDDNEANDEGVQQVQYQHRN